MYLFVKDIYVADCGEIAKDGDWQYCDCDGTADNLPPFPADWDLSHVEQTVCLLLLSDVAFTSNNPFVNDCRKAIT